MGNSTYTSALEAKQTELKSFMDNGIKVDGQNVEVKSEDVGKVRKLMGDITELKTLHEAEQMTSDDYMGGPGQSVAMGANVAGQAQTKSLGEMFTASSEFKQMIRQNSGKMDQPFELNTSDISMGGTYGQKDLYTGSVTGLNPQGFGRIQRDPMVSRPQRPNRVRDLFSNATTDANLIDYFRMLGFVGADPHKSGAATVPERTGTGSNAVFGLKPQSSLRFESAQAPVRTIAHWEAAHRNVLADEPQLQSVINNELLYGLSLEEDDQILNGDGTGENLLGVLNTPNIQQYTGLATDQYSDQLRKSVTLSVLANYPGTGFVMHPLDWEKLELQKASGDGQYMLTTNVAIGASSQVWRQPVVESPAMTEGKWLTGAFGFGAQLYDRAQASVRIAEQHADFFLRNAVVVLVEERLALAVKRPESFVLGSFTAPTAPTTETGV